MAVLPQFSKAYGHPPRRTTIFPSRLRIRYLVILAALLSIWYFIFLRTEELPSISSYTGGFELPNPLHTVHEVDHDSVANVDPLWNPKPGAVEEVPPNPVDQKKADDLAAAALLNTHPDEQSGSIDTTPEPPADVVEAPVDAAPQAADTAAAPKNPVVNEDLAEILRVHEASGKVDQLENKPIDTELLESLKKIETANADGKSPIPPEKAEQDSVTPALPAQAAAAAAQAVKADTDDSTEADGSARQPLNEAFGASTTTAEVLNEDKAAVAPAAIAPAAIAPAAIAPAAIAPAAIAPAAKAPAAKAPIDTTPAPKPPPRKPRPISAYSRRPLGRILLSLRLVSSLSPSSLLRTPQTNPSLPLPSGDSWSYTAFDVSGPAPSPQNPLGNPPLPQNGTSHPPSWLHYLSTTYNTTYLRTYNIARGAATVDRAVVLPHPGFLFTWTFKEQAADVFGLAYSGHPLTAPWNKKNALFAVWFGVVDIALLLERDEYTSEVNVANMASYLASLETLFAFGARRFLLLTVPPINLMPGVTKTALAAEAVADFNARLSTLQTAFLAAHPDAEVALYDLNGLLTSIIADPSSTLQTSGLKNTTDVCWIYNPDANAESMPWDRFDEECGVRYNEYFWANTLHPTYPVHDAIAAGVVGDCYGVGGRKGFCR